MASPTAPSVHEKRNPICTFLPEPQLNSLAWGGARNLGAGKENRKSKSRAFLECPSTHRSLASDGPWSIARRVSLDGDEIPRVDGVMRPFDPREVMQDRLLKICTREEGRYLGKYELAKCSCGLVNCCRKNALPFRPRRAGFWALSLFARRNQCPIWGIRESRCSPCTTTTSFLLSACNHGN